MKDEDKKYYVELQDITTIQVDGNRTYLEVQAYAIINNIIYTDFSSVILLVDLSKFSVYLSHD